ncbi:MAG: nucleoside triphosphate pyrophosphohydrolase [Candidatus Puniceispirillales bacterium]|jgi:ATP diphosphatase
MKKISNKNNKELNNLKSINKIRKIIKILRDPDDGCPWDIKQNFNSLAPYTIEEAYELVDAIEQNDIKSIKSELGDLLLQIILISQIASDNNYFNFDDVAEDISEKMMRRHPQIFDYNYNLNDFPQESWERIKNIEKSKKANKNNHLLDTIEKNIPAMLRSIKIQKKASSMKFDWKDLNDVINKVDEELNELKEAIDNKNKLHIEEELGDLLFTIVNLSRHLKLDPEQTLRKSNNKFISRFNIMENILDEKKIEWHDLKKSDLLNLWNEAKDQLKRG